MKIKIAFVQPSLPCEGGAEQVIYDLIMGLDRDKFDPLLVCLHELGGRGEKLRDQGVRTIEGVAHGNHNPINILRVASILRKERADVLYVTDAFHNVVVGRLAAVIARTPHTVLSFHSYDTREQRKESKLRRLLIGLSDRLVNPSFHQVIALAEDHREYLISTKWITAGKISVIHNGIDVQRYDSSASPEQSRAQFQLPLDRKLVGIIAGLRPCKAHDMFLKAAKIVVQQEPNVMFVVAGDGSERQNLERLTADLGLRDHVRFLGQVSEIPTLLRALDLSVLSSFSEAFPLTLLEAMSSARPVVSTNVGSVDEIVDDGVDGFLVPSGDVDRFAARILDVIRDDDLATRFGAAGRTKVLAHFTVDNMVRQTELLFESAFANRLSSRSRVAEVRSATPASGNASPYQSRTVER